MHPQEEQERMNSAAYSKQAESLAGLMRWRTGRKAGRTIYAQRMPHATDDDILIGMMDSPEIARLVVADHNSQLESASMRL